MLARSPDRAGTVGVWSSVQGMVEHQFECLPDGLAELPAGSALASALATVDPAQVAPADLAVLLAAARRQLSADEARFARCARELALADVTEDGGRGEVLGEFAADEVRAVLSISRTAAWRLVGRADDTARRLPALGAAWQRGEIDADRVRAFCTYTDGLSDVHARRVVDVVLPEAPRLTQSALIARIREVAIALDPEWRSGSTRTPCANAGCVRAPPRPAPRTSPGLISSTPRPVRSRG